MERLCTAQSKHRVKKLSKFMITVVIIYVAVSASAYGLSFALGVESPIRVVDGTSMLPAYVGGEIVILRGIPKEDIKEGDVIVYFSHIWNMDIIHRVIHKESIDGKLYFTTQGDNVATADPRFPAEDVKGVVIFPQREKGAQTIHIPALGVIYLALQSPIGKVLTGALIVIILLLDVFGEEDKGDKKPKTGNAL